MTKVPFDPTKTAVNLGGVPISGFADGMMIEAEFDEATVTAHKGVGKAFRFVLNPSGKGKIKVRLTGYSASNNAFMALHLSKVPTFMIVSDPTSNADVFTTDAVMVEKLPPLVIGQEATMNEWILIYGDAKVVHSGAREI